MKRKLPLDPFDPQTPFSKDYQVGNFAWAILLIGLICGLLLIWSADFDRYWGWLQAAVGIAVLAGSISVARRLIRSI